MLSIARLRVGQEAYQLSGVAESLDAYYTGAGEIAGAWVGGGAERLGLKGDVTAEDLRAVLAGLAPGSGGLSPNGDQPNTHPRRAPGFDFTFKAPKSASVLYAVSDDPRVQGAVIEAGEHAMRETLGWLEREAVCVRRGSHNKAWLAAHADQVESTPRRIPTSGVVAASFRHRTSRAGDPLLHWHVLVANMAEGTDGRWSALTHPELYRHMHAAGQIFQATYRAELTKALGVEWRPGRYVHEIAGVPQAILDLFSKRTAEVDAWLAATGTPNTPVGRQEAVLATRRSKHEQEHIRFDSVWKEEAEAAGWGPDRAEDLVAFAANRTTSAADGPWRLTTATIGPDGEVEHVDRLVVPEEWIEDLLRRELTMDRTTFSAADIHQAVAARLGDGAPVATVERIAARVLASPQTIAVGSDANEPDRWTSSEILAVESRFVAAVDRTLRQLNSATRPAAEAATHADLGPDQRAAVHTLLASTSAVSVLIGPAGTGKTYTLDAVRAGLENAGCRVLGAAPSARAAIELEAGAGIPTSTLHALLRRWDQHLDAPDPNTILVIDEAGMADIRTLEAAVTRHTTAGGRVILVGDHHQLPEVGAGGGFAYAARHAHTIAELAINRRQQEPWEQDALSHLRDGSVPDAVAAYLAHDRVLVSPNPRLMIDTAVDHWFTARAAGQHPVLLAGTTDLVDRLNTAVIDRLIDHGELPDAAGGRYGAGSYRVGERVVLRRNSTLDHDGHTVTLANGQGGTITALADQTLTVQLDAGPTITLDHRYLQAGGHLSHAYALTTHRAQGGTWDTAIAVGADGLYREGAYVELSRGRHTNLLVLTDPEAAELARAAATDTERHDSALIPPHEQAGEVGDELAQRMSRSRAKDLAHTLDPDFAIVDQLATTHSWQQLHTRRDHALTAEHTAFSLADEPREQLVARRDRLEHIAHHLALGQQVSPHDRHNIGTVTAIDDRAGEAALHFVSRNGSEAIRRFRWEDLRIVEPQTPVARPLTPAGRRHLAGALAEIDQRIADIDQHLAAAGVHAGDAHRYTRAIDRQIGRAAHTLRAEQPDWLTALVGQRPTDVAGAHTWDDAVRAIATWRLDHDVEPHTPGLGPRPTTAAAAHAWDELQSRLGLTRTWLDTTDRTHEAWPAVPSRRELNQRLGELDEILASAPADCRDVIHQLQAGQLGFDDTTDLLQAAHDQQDARRAWIIEHWPHVVEYQEIQRTLDAGTCGPDPALLTQLLELELTDTLETAIRAGDAWLRPALTAIADATTTILSNDQIAWLEDVADYRHSCGVGGREPLGRGPERDRAGARHLQLRADDLRGIEGLVTDPIALDMDIDLDI